MADNSYSPLEYRWHCEEGVADVYQLSTITNWETEMTESDIRQRILDMFNKERERPNTDFIESHFLDFLSSPPHLKDTIKNSFKGARRYYRFMDSLELEFGICFTLSDLDSYYSVDSLTKKVLERISKRRGNLMILKQRNEENEKGSIMISSCYQESE